MASVRGLSEKLREQANRLTIGQSWARRRTLHQSHGLTYRPNHEKVTYACQDICFPPPGVYWTCFSPGGIASVDDEVGARGEARRVGGEVEDGGCDLPRLGETSERSRI